MPIYLVRWPALSVSLVRAEDEEHLVTILDQSSNPDGCAWWVYDGPLAIDVELPVRWHVRDERSGEPVTPDQVVVEDIGPMVREHVVDTLQLALANGEEGGDTAEAILDKAFPVLQATLEEFQSRDEAEEQDFIPPEADLHEALHTELARLLTASWRRAQVDKGKDPISQLTRDMDMPVALVQALANGVAKGRQSGGVDPTAGEQGGGSASNPKAPTAGRLFEVSSHHSTSGDKPPFIDGDDPGKYSSYFVNEYGEQAVYTYEHRTGEATLRMSDAGWETAYAVVEGQVDGLSLTKSEQHWLQACWMATGAFVQRGRSR